MNDITEALTVVAELTAAGIGIYAADGELHLYEKHYPTPELWQRWEASKPTIIGLLGIVIPLRIPELEPDPESYSPLLTFVDIETAFPLFWAPRN